MKRDYATLLSYDLARLQPDDFEDFLGRLRQSAVISEKEIESIQVCVAYFHLLMYPARTAALKHAMAMEMYKDIRASPR